MYDTQPAVNPELGSSSMPAGTLQQNYSTTRVQLPLLRQDSCRSRYRTLHLLMWFRILFRIALLRTVWIITFTINQYHYPLRQLPRESTLFLQRTITWRIAVLLHIPKLSFPQTCMILQFWTISLLIREYVAKYFPTLGQSLQFPSRPGTTLREFSPPQRTQLFKPRILKPLAQINDDVIKCYIPKSSFKPSNI